MSASSTTTEATTAQIRQSLTSTSLPPPSNTWLSALLSSRPRPLPPLKSLTATARARILAADLQTPGLLDPTYASKGGTFPAWVGVGVGTGTGTGTGTKIGPEIQEARLPNDMVVQILDIENLSRSRWEQVDELESVARGEKKQGRQIVRLPSVRDDDDANDDGGGEAGEDDASQPPPPQRTTTIPSITATAPAATSGPKDTHRLTLQDCAGQKLFALELSRVDKLGVGTTFIGEKVMLRRGTVVARGTVLLEPKNVVVLGGKVEAWHRAWEEGRLARLKEAAGIGEGRRV